MTTEQHLAGERDVSQYMLQVELHPPTDQHRRKIWPTGLSKTGVCSPAMELNFHDFTSHFLAATIKFGLEDPIVEKPFHDLGSESVGREVDNESAPTVVGASSP